MPSKRPIGYGVSGYTLEGNTTSSSSSGSGGSAASSDGTLPGGGLIQDGNYIPSTKQAIVTVLPYGAFLVKDKEDKLAIVPSGSESEKAGNLQTGQKMLGADVTLNANVEDGTELISGCAVSKGLIDEWFDKMFPNESNLKTNVGRLIQNKSLKGALKLRTGQTTAIYLEVPIVAIETTSVPNAIKLNRSGCSFCYSKRYSSNSVRWA